ncbi:MAG: hypothetical protein FJZ01_26535 [Candidatus Sericytochromatia bacterium]|nr:hypothetical protein [Candidatus Tanganyikabacteria bacterium]
MTPKAVAAEVKKLSRVGLLDTEFLGPSRIVRINPQHPAVRPLRDLLTLDDSQAVGNQEQAWLESLAFWGAPFALIEKRPSIPLESALLQGLKAARTDGAVMRVLPLVVAKQGANIDWVSLVEGARRAGIGMELGAIIALAADLLGSEALADRAAPLRDRRFSRIRYLPEPRSKYERELADQRTPDVVRPWGVRMNMTRDSLASLFEKHLA